GSSTPRVVHAVWIPRRLALASAPDDYARYLIGTKRDLELVAVSGLQKVRRILLLDPHTRLRTTQNDAYTVIDAIDLEGIRWKPVAACPCSVLRVPRDLLTR